jgi:hypothetical protein
VQLKAYNLLLQEFRDKNPIPIDSIEEIPGFLAAVHLETVKAVKKIAGNAKHRIHEKFKERHSHCKRTATSHPPG